MYRSRQTVSVERKYNVFKKLALFHEFDDNVAVLATTVSSITVSGKITPAEVAASSWGSVCVPVACPQRQCQQRQ